VYRRLICSLIKIIRNCCYSGPGIISLWKQIFRTHPERPWEPTSHLESEYLVSFLGVKRSGRGVDHPLPSSAKVEGSVRAIPPLPLRVCMVRYKVKCTLLLSLFWPSHLYWKASIFKLNLWSPVCWISSALIEHHDVGCGTTKALGNSSCSVWTPVMWKSPVPTERTPQQV